jgi:hypothetical protein
MSRLSLVSDALRSKLPSPTRESAHGGERAGGCVWTTGGHASSKLLMGRDRLNYHQRMMSGHL